MCQTHAKGTANVLKELIASAVILPFMARKPVPNPQPMHSATDEGLAQVSAEMATVSGTDLTPAKWPPLTAIEAAKVFFLEMQRSFPGEAIELKWVRHTYDQLGRERGWPTLSDKALSMHLVSFGCKRIKVDYRSAGGGRVTAFEFPGDTAAQRRRRKK